MVAIVSLLFVITISILITRVATVALAHTGLSKQSARFQARSAFTGVGFTTEESEKVVNHPVRRRILLLLMLLGNAGIVTAMSSLILTFVGDGSSTSLPLKVGLLIVGIAVLFSLANSHWVDHRLSNLISWALARYSSLDVKDYASLLQLTGDYRVTELHVEAHDWLACRQLQELGLRDEGILVLGMHRKDGTYLGAPRGPTKILPDDTLIVYGRIPSLEQLDQRRKGFLGDMEHHEAVAEQEEIVEKQEAEDEEHSDSATG